MPPLSSPFLTQQACQPEDDDEDDENTLKDVTQQNDTAGSTIVKKKYIKPETNFSKNNVLSQFWSPCSW